MIGNDSLSDREEENFEGIQFSIRIKLHSFIKLLLLLLAISEFKQQRKKK